MVTTNNLPGAASVADDDLLILYKKNNRRTRNIAAQDLAAYTAESAPVQSVNSKTGDVQLSTTDIPEGTNLYFTDARAAAAAPVQSVNAQTGDVIIDAADVGADPAGTAASEVSDLESRLANDTDSLLGAGLIGYKLQTVADKLSEQVTPFDYGAIGDGVADDTAAVQSAFSSGVRVNLGGPGVVYKASSQLTVPANADVSGNGAVIQFTIPAATAVAITGSNARVNGVVLVGPNANDTYTASSVAVSAQGTVGSYLSGIEISECKISNFGQTAIFAQFISDSDIENNQISQCGYAGVQVLSGRRVRVKGNNIDRMYPGSGGGIVGTSAAYGVHITRDASKSLALAPTSFDVIIADNIVSRVTTWEGIDTHGGKQILFSNNVVRDCWVAGNVIHADGGGDLCPAESVTFIGNVFSAGNEPGAALYLKPSSSTTIGAAAPVSVIGNSLYRYGTYNTAVSSHGAIYAENCVSGLVVTGNHFHQSKYIAVRLNTNNFGVVISGNMFCDLLTVSSVNRAISVDTASNSVNITANSFVRTSGSFDAIYVGFGTADVVVSADNSYIGTMNRFTGIGRGTNGTSLLASSAVGNFNGTTGATRRAIGMSCTRNSTGNYTITLDRPMPDTNYMPDVCANQPISFISSITSTSQFVVVTQSAVGTPADADLLIVKVAGG